MLCSLAVIGIFVGLISYSYFNYGTMEIIRLDRTVLQKQEASAYFVDISGVLTTIPKLQEGIDKVGKKYDNILQTCNNDTQGYCNGIPINAVSSTIITAGEFQSIENSVHLNPMRSSNDTWFSNVKYSHEGCFPPANDFALDSSKSDNYCYYDIVVEKK